MDYQADNHKRISRAMAASMGFHAALLVALVAYRVFAPMPPLVYKPPIVVFLKPPAAPQSRSLVDIAQPAQHPVEKTDLIAEQDSNASGPVQGESNRPAPTLEKVSTADEVGHAPAPPQPALQNALAHAPSLRAAVTQLAQEKARAGAQAQAKAAAPSPETAPDAQPKPSDKPKQDERFEVAQAAPEPQPVVPESPPTPPQAREGEGVKTLGFVGFEAMRDQLAPYFKEVRARVEREWHMILQTRYSGVGKVEAVLDCTIAPDGRVVSVEIVTRGSSATYAPLCKAAVEQAGPFGPFPFQVPEIYRDKNLQIRWTFTYE